MKSIWITESGIIHHRKPEMDATEYVEVQQQVDAEALKRKAYIEITDVLGMDIRKVIDHLASQYDFVRKAGE